MSATGHIILFLQMTHFISVECYILQVLHATPRVVLAILSVVNSSQAGRYRDNKRDLGTL